jgi:tetratricopeptide (TPR) repeat protein
MAKFSQEFLRQMANPAMAQGLFTTAKQAAQLPGQLQQMEQAKQMRQQVASIDTNSPQGLLQLAQFYRQQGDIENAVRYEEAARQLQSQITAQTAFGARKTSLASAATTLGMTDLAQRVEGVTDQEELREIAKEIRKTELSKIPTQTPLVRKRMANAAGIPPDLFDELKLATVSDSIFNDYISGEKGDLKPYQKDNKVQFFRVNERGRVWDQDQLMWVEASQLNLEEAPPQVQRVENVATGMADELSKIGAKNFAEAHENARLAADALGSVNRTLPTIDNMFTGAGAELKLNISRYTRAFGVDVVDPSTITDTETYIAESGRRVAQYITNLGAGTGLSDADREYAKQVVAGNITVDATSLKRLLGVIKQNAQRTISNYNTTRSDIEKELGENNKGALAFYGDIFVDSGPTASGLSPQAQSYLQ